MAKDPAMLWYWNDWNSGTVTLSRFLKGCYIDLLHAQFNNGHLSIEEIRIVLGPDFDQSWPSLKKKFLADKDGLFFNERLEIEQKKRMAFSESRRSNISKRYESTYVEHTDVRMENRNRDINTNDIKGGVGEKTKDWFVSCLDDIYKETLAMTHKGKDVDQAIAESWVFLSADKIRLHNANSSDVKKLVNTWLGNMKNEKAVKKPSFNLKDI